MLNKIEAARKGNNQAFYEVISHYSNKLYNTARFYLSDEQEALEAVQEVTCRAYIRIKKLKDPTAFGAWLGRIMHNYCMDVLKKSKRLVPFEDMDRVREFHDLAEQQDPSDIGNETALQMDIQEYMSHLRPDFKEVLILRYFQDLGTGEISRIMNKPEGTVKTWLNRGLVQLRRMMERA